MLVIVFLLIVLAAMSGSNVSSDFVDRFHALDPSRWVVSDHWSNGKWFLCDWRKSQVRAGPGGMTVTVVKNPASANGYSSGEIQSRKLYQFGYYEARMTAAAGSGLDTAFFTYTGAPRGHPWNEIDVEILGKDTKSVEFSYHTQNHSQSTVIKLPFDSAIESHTYGFDWEPGYVAWYIDGRLAHKETGPPSAMPNDPQQIMFDVWNSNVNPPWMGTFSWPGHPIDAHVQCIAYSAKVPGAQLC